MWSQRNTDQWNRHRKFDIVIIVNLDIFDMGDMWVKIKGSLLIIGVANSFNFECRNHFGRKCTERNFTFACHWCLLSRKWYWKNMCAKWQYILLKNSSAFIDARI